MGIYNSRNLKGFVAVLQKGYAKDIYNSRNLKGFVALAAEKAPESNLQ